VTFEIEGEYFTYTGKNVVKKGWTELMPWKAIDTKEQIPNIKRGDKIEIHSVSRLFGFYFYLI
jgi:DNA topoisomerase IA